jgi:alanine racemase
MIYTLSEISKIINSDFIGSNDYDIEYILIDSRTIVTTQQTLFFAINGERHDAHKFINELYQKGIRSFVVEKLPENYVELKDASFLVVKKSILALQKLAAYHRNRFNYPVIGITGSNGKTIVKEWLYYTLQIEKCVVRSPKSFNSQIGVPLSVLLMDNLFDLAIFEAGISLPNEMERLQNILNPDIGLITNISEPHQENFIDLEQKATEKLKLFADSKVLIYCKDHKLIHDLISKDKELSKKQLFTWSEIEESDLKISSIDKSENKTSIQYRYENTDHSLSIPFTHKASIENAIHVLALVCSLDLKPNDYASRFAHLPSVAMRMELKSGVNNCTIINDSYNSDLNSLSIALNYLNQQNQHKRKTVILSDILQSGKSDKDLYQEISELISKFKIDKLIGIGEAISEQAEKFNIQSEFYKTTQEFLSGLKDNCFSDEAILLKGSRQFYFEKISAVIEEKVNRTVLEINLNALVHNLNHFKSKLLPKTKIMVMVKALAYGSGTYEIANVLQYQGVDFLGVAMADEGVALRQAGIKTRIIVMNPENNSFELMLEYNLEPEIYNFKVLRQFQTIVSKKGLKNYPIHIKLDSGMHRLGFVANELNQLIAEIKQSDCFKVSSVFSHLAASDEPEHDSFTLEQIDVFKSMSESIMDKFSYLIDRHILNSAGIERFADAQFEMVRLGIGLYGISSIEQEQLEVVSTLKSTVLQIKQVAKNDTVGYSRKAKAVEDITIAVIPIGYADGLDRRMGNGLGTFFINGCYVPIIGNVCMDMCMVDITGCNIHEGDEAILFGKERSVLEVAKLLNTIPYEIFTGISTRVKRVYFQE